MRLLVVDSSGILPWRVRHALGDGHEVIATGCLEEAELLAHSRHPDAAVVSVPHASLPWGSFHDLCAAAHPPIPVLYESCLPGGLAALGIARRETDDRDAALLTKPASQCELARALERLLAEAGRAHGELSQISLAVRRES